MNPKKRNTLRILSIASIAYTLWVTFGAFQMIIAGHVEADIAYYPAMVALEGMVLLLAAAIPLCSTFSNQLLRKPIARWIGLLCVTYGIFISVNFFLRMGIGLTEAHFKVGLSLASWIGIATLTHWKLKR